MARDAGVPAIYAEYHGGGSCDPTGVAAYVRGCLDVLADLALIDAASSVPRPDPLIIEDDRPDSLKIGNGEAKKFAGMIEDVSSKPVMPTRSKCDIMSCYLRSPALLASLFSGIALLLTAIGTYGVLSYAVAQRRREIGLRMALGAQPGQIRSQFFNLSLRLLAGGTLLGLIGAWQAGRAMQAVLFHVPSLNLAILAGAVCVMGLVSLVACVLPSQRAARISPMEALAEE